MSLFQYENVEKMKIWYILTHPNVCGGGIVIAGLWIRIRIHFPSWIRIHIQYADPDPDPGG